MPQWLIDFADRLLFQLKALVLTIYTFLKDSLLWFFEQSLILVTLILDGMADMFSGLNITQYFDAIPPEVGWVMNQLGIGEATGMIISAVLIRLTLQLIPFTRLGS